MHIQLLNVCIRRTCARIVTCQRIVMSSLSIKQTHWRSRFVNVWCLYIYLRHVGCRVTWIICIYIARAHRAHRTHPCTHDAQIYYYISIFNLFVANSIDIFISLLHLPSDVHADARCRNKTCSYCQFLFRFFFFFLFWWIFNLFHTSARRRMVYVYNADRGHSYLQSTISGLTFPVLPVLCLCLCVLLMFASVSLPFCIFSCSFSF